MAQDQQVCESGAAEAATETAGQDAAINKLGVAEETAFEASVFDLKVDF